MAKQTRVWRGSREIHLQPGYPDQVETASGTKTLLVYEGPFETLLNTRPKVGQKMKGYGDLQVEEVKVKPKGAGRSGPGVLSVTLATESPPGGMITSGGSEVTWEVEWVDLARKLEQAPIYSTGGGKELTNDDLDKIEEWRNADSRAKRNAVYSGLSTNAKHFVDKVRRGIETYIAPAPVVRKTTRSYLAPATTTMGKQSASKPFTTAPDGYKWLGTADKSLRQGTKGKWERVEERTGATSWDTDLYPNG